MGNALAGVCIEKKIDFQSIDMATVLSIKENAQKLFAEVCTKGKDCKVVEIDSEEIDVDHSKKRKQVKK